MKNKSFVLTILVLMLFGTFLTLSISAEKSGSYGLIYSTYFGWTTSYDKLVSVDVRNGQAYVVGNFPIRGKGNEVYYAKLTKSGRDVEFLNFFGGSRDDSAFKIRVDNSGNIYLFGTTMSEDLPVKNAYQRKLAGDVDFFLAKLSPEGDIIFTTYFGGKGKEEPLDMEIDDEGNIYITGITYSDDFPTINSLLSFSKIKEYYPLGSHPLMAKFDSNGQLIFSSYWYLLNMQIAPAKSGFYVGGYTEDINYPTTGAFDSSCGTKKGKCDPYSHNGDIAITKFDDNLNIVYSTFIGGSSPEILKDIYVGEDGYVYAAGAVVWKNADFPVKNPIDLKKEGDGADYGIVFKMTPNLKALVYSTYFLRESQVISIRADKEGNTYITGVTGYKNASHLMTPDAFQKEKKGPTDTFFAKLSPNGELLYATLFGGTGEPYPIGTDTPSEIAIENGEAYIVGWTVTWDFPTTRDAFKQFNNDPWGYYSEGFLVKFGFNDYSPEIPMVTLNKTISIGKNVFGRDIKEVNDGYIILGVTDSPSKYTPLLIKTDLSGNPLWVKEYGEVAGNSWGFWSLIVDDGYLIFGTTNGKATLIKTDWDGNVVWSRNYAEYGDFQRGRDMIKTQDGYILMGVTNGTRGGTRGVYNDLFLVKVDKSGNPLWESYIDVKKAGISPDLMPYQIKKARDGYIIVGETVKDGLATAFVIKTDLKGAKEWVRFLGTNSMGDRAYSRGFSVEVVDDGYLIGGLVDGNFFGGADMYLAKLDFNGNLVRENVKGRIDGFESAYKLLKSGDSFVVLDSSGDTVYEGRRGYFFKFNSDGIKEYSIKLDMPKDDYAEDMERVSDGYLVLFSSNSFSENFDLWLIKIEAPKIIPSTQTSTTTTTMTSTTSSSQTQEKQVSTEEITETAKELATSATEKAKEVATGICGPGVIVGLALLPLLFRRKIRR